MGFFQNVKNKLGIGGVKVKLQVPGQVSKNDNSVSGTIVLTTKSDQEITEYSVKMVEELSTGRNEDKETREYDLGEITIQNNFNITSGETKTLDFNLPFNVIKTNADSLKEKGGMLGKLGSAAKFANNEKSRYYIEAYVDVKSAVLDPSERKEINLV